MVKIKKLKKQDTPANFNKITSSLKKDIVLLKFTQVNKLNTRTRVVSMCFHPVSRIIEI